MQYTNQFRILQLCNLSIGDHHPFEKQKSGSYQHGDSHTSHISLPNFQKDSHHEGGSASARTSVRKSNMKSGSSSGTGQGVRISGMGHSSARNNAMV